jgi:hypothetical protein
MVFNKSLNTEEAFWKIRDKIQSHLGYYKHPKDLTTTDIAWLKKNIKQFDKKVLDKIIAGSMKSNKPK